MLAVSTQTSAYLINQEEGWIQRVPGDPDAVRDPAFRVAACRLDGERIPLIKMLSDITVGEDLVMLINVVGDGETVTVRRTTPVREIIDVTDPEASHVAE